MNVVIWRFEKRSIISNHVRFRFSLINMKLVIDLSFTQTVVIIPLVCYCLCEEPEQGASSELLVQSMWMEPSVSRLLPLFSIFLLKLSCSSALPPISPLPASLGSTRCSSTWINPISCPRCDSWVKRRAACVQQSFVQK